MITNTIKPDTSFNETLKLLNEEVERSLDIKAENITNFMKNNDGRGTDDNTKDKLYKDAQILHIFHNLILHLSNHQYHLDHKD